jgi:3-phosphoshikimate 1-carboxyvinyltransferase
MKWKVTKSRLSGSIAIPPSKSHTIRALLVATLANGTSHIANALTTGDGGSAISAARGMGAQITVDKKDVTVCGIGGDFNRGSEKLDLENSGTSTNLFASVAALGSKPRTFDGDSSLRTRPFAPVLEALAQLGAKFTLASKTSDLPFIVSGPIRGGSVTVDGFSSQSVSSLLFACPCAQENTTIRVVNLHEKPYVEMTLAWLDKLGIRYTAWPDLTAFEIMGNQKYPVIDYTVPGDFSSATFAAVAAPLTGSCLTLQGLDFSDSQGDKLVFDIIVRMGAKVLKNGSETVVDGCDSIHGRVIDLNAIPDSLPALSVLACAAKGETRIVNVAQARIKETDRITVMAQELGKMGANITEHDDGLTIRNSKLTGTSVKGHGDHRVVMALTLAGMIAEGETVIDTAESAAVTYPTFREDFCRLGAHIEEFN